MAASREQGAHDSDAEWVDVQVPDNALWDEAVVTMNRASILSILNIGYIPEKINDKILVQDYKDSYTELTPLQLLMMDDNFLQADQFLELGAELPEPEMPNFESRSEYFKYLVTDCSDLYIALRTQPRLICEQDENGDNLLHHAVRILTTNYDEEYHYRKALELLFGERIIKDALKMQNHAHETPISIANFGKKVNPLFKNFVVQRSLQTQLLASQFRAIVSAAAQEPVKQDAPLPPPGPSM